MNAAADLLYSYELACNAAARVFDEPCPQPTAAAARLGYDGFGDRSNKAWIVDSGANRHISAIASDFVNLKLENGGTISGISVPIRGSGSVHVNVVDNTGTKRRLTLHDVLYAPDLSDRSGHSFHRIFSVRQANDIGCSVSFRPKNDLLVSSNGHQYFLIRRDGLTWLPVYDPDLPGSSSGSTARPTRPDAPATGAAAATSHAPTAAILHRRCCHLNEADIQKLIKMGVLGKPRLTGDTFCKPCAMAKSREANVNRSSTRDRDPPAPFHTAAMDIWGPMSTPAIGGFRFVIGLTDFKTAAVLAELVQQKSDAPKVLTDFLRHIRSLGHSLHTLRIDNDTVLLSERFQSICDAHNISIQRTAPYAHHQLGRQERQWRTLSEAVKAMLLEAGLDKRFWGHAFLTAVHVRNRVWNSGSQCIPMEAVTGTRPTLDHLRVFGSPAYVNIPSSLRRKLSDAAWEGIFVGYAPDSPAWLIYNPRTRNVVRSRSVTFNEYAGLGGERRSHPTVLPDADDCVDTPKAEPTHKDGDDAPIRGETTEAAPGVLTRSAAARIEHARQQQIYADAAQRAMKAGADEVLRLLTLKDLHGDNLHHYLQQEVNGTGHTEDDDNVIAAAAVAPEPASYRKAMSSPDRSEWQKAITKEYDSQIKNKTWTLVALPAGRRAIGCLWRFKVKRDQNGNIIKYKARLCARGDHQQEGIDYFESFCPTVRYQTLRTLLALACHHDLEVEQFDAVCAFLNADVSESIYMDQPEGFEQTTPEGGRLVCKLNRALYGLVQAPRCWNQKVTEWLEQYGFEQSMVDPGIYILQQDKKVYILALYVDDAICIGRHISFINKLKQDFAKAFD